MDQLPVPNIAPTQFPEPPGAVASPESQRGENLARVVRTLFKTLSKAWISCATILGSVFLLFILGIIFLLSGLGREDSNDNVLSGTGPEKIAVVRLSGIIDESASSSDLLSGPTSTITPDLVQDYIDRILSDKQVRGVIFRLNSPGGTIVASDQINEKIDKLRAKGIKVIFLYSDVAASGGYYISAGADKIIANPTTITGSIGVISEVLNVSGLYEKLGLKDEVYKSGKNKDLLNPARERTAEEVAIIQRLINQALEQFIDRVSTGRKMDRNKVKEIADGRIYSGIDAKNLGLIDELGNFDKAVEIAKKETNLTDPQIIEYNEPSFLESLFSGKIFKFNPLSFFSRTPATSSGLKMLYLLNL